MTLILKTTSEHLRWREEYLETFRLLLVEEDCISACSDKTPWQWQETDTLLAYLINELDSNHYNRARQKWKLYSLVITQNGVQKLSKIPLENLPKNWKKASRIINSLISSPTRFK